MTAQPLPSISNTLDDKLIALREIGQQSADLHARVSEALGAAIRTVLAGDREVTAPARFVRAEIKARAARGQVFDTDLFRDPAWDMLLDLYDAHAQGRVTSVSSLCIAAQVPATTGLRYIAAMEKEGFVTRHRDETDHRRVLIEPSAAALEGVDKVARRFSQSI